MPMYRDVKLSTCADLKVYEWKGERGFDSKPEALNDLIESIDLAETLKHAKSNEKQKKKDVRAFL